MSVAVVGGENANNSLFENVDCVSFYVDNLDDGIEFYKNKLGLGLQWRAEGSCGLGLRNGITELVLVTEHNPAVNFKVESVEEALAPFIEAGGRLEYGPFDIDIGKCAVVADRWGNRFCLLDMTKGTYNVDGNGNVTGVD